MRHPVASSNYISLLDKEKLADAIKTHVNYIWRKRREIWMGYFLLIIVQFRMYLVYTQRWVTTDIFLQLLCMARTVKNIDSYVC